MQRPRFSVILCTVGREAEVEAFLESLGSQALRDFEVIIVDQNVDQRLLPVLQRCSDGLEIKHLRVPFRALSKARNHGLRHAKGDILCFPDDDCSYADAGLLAKVSKKFADGNIEFLSCRVISPGGRNGSGAAPNLLDQGRSIGNGALLKTLNSITLFVKNNELQFDEELGIGARFGSGEETDYAARLIKQGKRGMYCPELEVCHPVKALVVSLSRSYQYARGMGALFKKNLDFFDAKQIFLYVALRPLGGFLVSFLKARPLRALEYACILYGRLEGFFEAKAPVSGRLSSL